MADKLEYYVFLQDVKDRMRLDDIPKHLRKRENGPKKIRFCLATKQ